MSYLIGVTRTRHEGPLARKLSGEGYAAYTPSSTLERRVKGKTEAVQIPAFPGYLFVDSRFALPAMAYARRHGTFLQYLRSGEEWGSLSDHIIEDYQRLEAEGAFTESYTVHTKWFSLGDWAKVEAGPAQGMYGYVQRIHRNGRQIWLDGGDFDKAMRLPRSILQKTAKPDRFVGVRDAVAGE